MILEDSTTTTKYLGIIGVCEEIWISVVPPLTERIITRVKRLAETCHLDWMTLQHYSL